MWTDAARRGGRVVRGLPFAGASPSPKPTPLPGGRMKPQLSTRPAPAASLVASLALATLAVLAATLALFAALALVALDAAADTAPASPAAAHRDTLAFA